MSPPFTQFICRCRSGLLIGRDICSDKELTVSVQVVVAVCCCGAAANHFNTGRLVDTDHPSMLEGCHFFNTPVCNTGGLVHEDRARLRLQHNLDSDTKHFLLQTTHQVVTQIRLTEVTKCVRHAG